MSDQSSWMGNMASAAAATLQAHTVWPPSLVEITVDDGGAADTPEYGETTFDEVSKQWTRGIVPNEVLRLKARIAALEAELARKSDPAAKAVAVFPSRALAFGLQNIGLRLPNGF